MGKTKIEPLGDRVLVEVLPLAEMSAGGVHLPEATRERSQRGLVLGVGPGRYDNGILIPVGIEEGDTVVFSKYGGTELPDAGLSSVEDKQLLILREADVLGIERAVPETACSVCGSDSQHHDRELHERRDEVPGTGHRFADESPTPEEVAAHEAASRTDDGGPCPTCGALPGHPHEGAAHEAAIERQATGGR